MRLVEKSDSPETREMVGAGFTWDPVRGYPRWTHFELDITCLRQPYMNDAQWTAERARCVDLAKTRSTGKAS